MRKLLETFQELNLSNYGPDDVDQLNAWAIDAYAELSALKAQEPVAEIALSDDGYKIGLLGALRNHRLPIGTKLYAAPVSEAKAQGVVMPPPPYMPGSQPTDFTDYELGEIHGRIAMWEEVKRLTAAPVQQVSVPDGWRDGYRAAMNSAASGARQLYVQHCHHHGVNGLLDRCKELEQSFIRDADASTSAAPAAPAADAWIQVSERLPDSGSTVIAYYLNSYGKGRTIRAQHVEAWTIEAEDVADPDTDCVEYSEQDDCYYLLQGWYECIDNWDEYYRVAVTEGPITHWMPLPAAPIKIEANRHDQ